MQFKETHLWVVSFPCSCLVYVNWLKNKSSKGCQRHVKDSLIWICSSGKRSHSNGAVQRLSAPASNTTHLRGGWLQSILAFTTFLLPLNDGISPMLSLRLKKWMYLHIWVHSCKPDFYCLREVFHWLHPGRWTRMQIFLVNGWSVVWGFIVGSWTICIHRGWTLVVTVWGFVVNQWNFLSFRVCGWPSINIFRQRLDPLLIKSQCMLEIADMFHPLDSPRKHFATMCQPDRWNSIPDILLSVYALKAFWIAITYQAPTKWTCISSYENVSLKCWAMDVFIPDPTWVTIESLLFGSTYSLYVLKIIHKLE